MAMSTRCKTRSNLLYMYPLSLIYIKSFILILNFLHPWVLLFSLAFRWNKDYLTIICSEGHKNKNYSLFELILIINTAICECFANIKWKKELSHCYTWAFWGWFMVWPSGGNLRKQGSQKGDKEPLLVQLAAVPINRYLEVAWCWRWILNSSQDILHASCVVTSF